MNTRTPAEHSLDVLEQLIRDCSIRSKVTKDGVHELTFIKREKSPTQNAKQISVKEWWVVQYVLKHHHRLGFTAVKGPFDIGPDLRVKVGREWHRAEVETGWRNYIRHEHHLNDAFVACRFLIVLSDEKPSGANADELPSKIVYIDRQHFAEWFAKASADYAREHQPQSKFDARLNIIAGNLQSEWVKVCPDKERSMATCPDCNSCAYFGEGTAGEATPTFQRLAVVFADKHCRRRTKDVAKRWDLSKVDESTLRHFVATSGL